MQSKGFIAIGIRRASPDTYPKYMMQIFMPWTVIVCILVVAVSPVMARLGLPSQLRLKPTQDEGVSGVDGLVCPRFFKSICFCLSRSET